VWAVGRGRRAWRADPAASRRINFTHAHPARHAPAPPRPRLYAMAAPQLHFLADCLQIFPQ
jgi:hypothetical protein